MCILLDCQCRYVVIVGNVLNPMLLCSVVLRQQYMTFGCLNCSQWWTPPLSSSFPRRGSSTSLRSFVSCTDWRLQSGLHSNNQSSCTSVCTGPHPYTLWRALSGGRCRARWGWTGTESLTSLGSRLVSDSVPVHPHHWLSAAPDSLLSVTELFRSPLHVSGTVCQLSLPQSASSVAVFRGPGLKLTYCLTFLIPFPVIVHCLRSDFSWFRTLVLACFI